MFNNWPTAWQIIFSVFMGYSILFTILAPGMGKEGGYY